MSVYELSNLESKAFEFNIYFIPNLEKFYLTGQYLITIEYIESKKEEVSGFYLRVFPFDNILKRINKLEKDHCMVTFKLDPDIMTIKELS
jgi:hypothetical protein